MQLRYQYVEVLQSREFSSCGIAEDSFWRFEGLADWTFKVGKWVDSAREHWYGGIGFHAGLKYYKGFEMPEGGHSREFG